MTGMYQSASPRPTPALNAGRLWAGGVATALVAALIAITGILIGRGLFGVAVLGPQSAGTWGTARTGWYTLGAALAGILATALMHLLVSFTPRPMRFFGWIIALATLAAMAAPMASDEDLGSRLYTAGLNLILGIAIGSLTAGTARAALRPTTRQPTPRPYPG